jgi:Ca2+-binding RTX toxin-like protein
VREDGSGKDAITGGSGADLIFAQSKNDTLTGGTEMTCCAATAAATRYAGGGGDDSAGGGSGGDRLTGGSGADRFSGGPDVDTATDFSAARGDTSDGTIP